MDSDDVWRTIDQQRLELADLMETFTDDEWERPSLCVGWRVRDVAAHLTLAQTGLFTALGGLVRARGSFNRMIHDTAVREAHLPVTEYPLRLRAMVGSRRTAPMVSDLEPLMDQLVHGQDMVVPLGRARETPKEAAAAAATRAWTMGFPFHARKRLGAVCLTATDHPWSIGEGPVVEGPIRAHLMLVTGRDVVLPELSGPGADALRTRLDRSAGRAAS
jgi:uncharacterized protein (TIGR03083 family)